MPLALGSHTVAGAVALRVVAALKGQRRRGSRFTHEQAQIERWLGGVEAALAEHAALGRELAACGRLIKGYGNTHERGQATLLHLVQQAATPAIGAPARADAIRAAREAALAESGGPSLDAALTARGLAAKAPVAQPVRWFKRRPA
jgi:indolepyruvate ferredoxin oxidoreductase beta subunit